MRRRASRSNLSRSRLKTVLLWYVLCSTFTSLSILRARNHESSLSTGRSHRQKRWVSTRTLLFSSRWKNHKYRNAALYTCLSTRNIFLVRWVVISLLSCPIAFYEQKYDELFEVPKFCFSHKCLQQFGKTHYIYAEFVLQTFDAITSRTISPARPSTDGKIAVLVEPRMHPLLEYTIKQVMTTIGSDWALQLFVSSENEKWVRSRFQIYQGGAGRDIVIVPLSQFGLNEMSKYGNRVQSAFSAHERVYKSISCEHILWFQVDVVLRSEINPEWLQYAYVGAEWAGCQYPTCSTNECDKLCGGGNSGLSLRRKSQLLRVATPGELPQDLWGVSSTNGNERYAGMHFSDPRAYFTSDRFHDNSKTRWFEDDLQISFKLSTLQLLPPGQVQSRFAIAQAVPKEGIAVANPVGMHKPWFTPHLEPQVVVDLLQVPFDRAVRPNDA